MKQYAKGGSYDFYDEIYGPDEPYNPNDKLKTNDPVSKGAIWLAKKLFKNNNATDKYHKNGVWKYSEEYINDKPQIKEFKTEKQSNNPTINDVSEEPTSVTNEQTEEVIEEVVKDSQTPVEGSSQTQVSQDQLQASQGQSPHLGPVRDPRTNGVTSPHVLNDEQFWKHQQEVWNKFNAVSDTRDYYAISWDNPYYLKQLRDYAIYKSRTPREDSDAFEEKLLSPDIKELRKFRGSTASPQERYKILAEDLTHRGFFDDRFFKEYVDEQLTQNPYSLQGLNNFISDSMGDLGNLYDFENLTQNQKLVLNELRQIPNLNGELQDVVSKYNNYIQDSGDVNNNKQSYMNYVKQNKSKFPNLIKFINLLDNLKIFDVEPALILLQYAKKSQWENLKSDSYHLENSIMSYPEWYANKQYYVDKYIALEEARKSFKEFLDKYYKWD